MSVPSESATSPLPCACTNISLMQLFHELKQKFPGVPDHVVSNTIELYCHDKQACEKHLHSEVKASLTHAYHASSSAAARQLNELRINPPGRCRNQPIAKHEVSQPVAVTETKCLCPQTAIISSSAVTDENNKNKLNRDANQNVIECIEDSLDRNKTNCSPVTVINIDKCFAKYTGDSPSDLELTNENAQDKANTSQQAPDADINENINYRISKSNKITNNFLERLEKGKEKKTIQKDERTETEEPLSPVPLQTKPKRPNTLDLPNPDIAFKQKPNTQQETISSPLPQKAEPVKESKEYRPERGYPLNLSVNVNCHMDYGRYGDPGLDDYDSPRAITSVNLTVCTPTSNMSSPVREGDIGRREEDSGFESHVTVTVSPSTARAPRRRAPPPPSQPSRIESPRPTRVAPELPESALDRSLIERQKERLGRLARAVAQEKLQLAQLNRETQILSAPAPSPHAAQQLRECVERLRDQCNTLAKRLEMPCSEPVEESDDFYSNIYTGQRPPASWPCRLCSFRNHPQLHKCEQCDMPRILVGTFTHDSGFGSFRDSQRSRKLSGHSQTDTDYQPDLLA